MNDLIKQFAIDCAGQKEWDFPKDPKSYTFTPDELTKFAELIVKECLSQVDKMDAVLEDDKEKIGVAWVGLAIAKHFGVES